MEELFDEEISVSDENDDGLDISRYDFNSFKIERSIRDLLSWEERKKIIIPDFQRNFVWTYNQCCKFIESILLNLPIPNLFVFREKNANVDLFLLLDGLQRYTCIKQFKKGVFIRSGEEKPFVINIKDSKWYKSRYDTLSEDDRNLFDDYSLILNVLEPVDNSEDVKRLFMTELFERINTGSEKLNDQEIRNAVYHGDVIDQIKSIAKNFWPESLLPSGDIERCAKEEFILRVLTYYNIYERALANKETICDYDKTDAKNKKITTSKRNMLSQYLFFSGKHAIDFHHQYELLTNVFNTISLYPKFLFSGCTTKGETTSKMHEVFSEALLINLMLNNSITEDFEKIKSYKEYYWKNTDIENNVFYSRTTQKETLLKRVDLVRQMIQGQYDTN